MREQETHDIGSHPDLDRWIAYRAGDLEPAEEETLRDHLVTCRGCTALVLDLESFADAPAAPSPAVSDFEKAAVWRILKPQLRPRSAGRRWHLPATLAASFLVAAFGGGLWLQHREVSGLRYQVAELSRPQANAPVYDLYPRATLRGETGSGPTLEVPAAAHSLLLILNGVEAEVLATDGAWRAEVLDAEGLPVARVDGLVMDELGIFTFALPRDVVAAGDHLVRLWGPGAGEAPVEEYPLRIVLR